MKTTLLLLFSVLVIQTATAQSRVDSTVTYNFITPTDSVPDYKTLFTYQKQWSEPILEINYDWDSTKSKWVFSGKYENAYDAAGNRTLYASYGWDSTKSQWVGSFKEEYTYDAAGKEILSISYGWDAVKNEWTGRYKYEYAYDIEGIEMQVIASYSTDNGWVRNYKQVKNNDKLLEPYFNYDWNPVKNEWVIISWYEIIYDSKGRIIQHISYFGDYDRSKNEYAYDAAGNITLFASYRWDSTKSQWVGSYKSESTYDASGNTILSASYFWDSTNNDWVGKDKNEYAYDAEGRNILSVFYKWDSTKKEWVVYHKHEYVYASGKIILYASYNWDSTKNEWVSEEKSEYAYDTEGRIIFNASYSWDVSGNRWVKVLEYQTIYSGSVILVKIDNDKGVYSKTYYYTTSNTELASLKFNDATTIAFEKDKLSYETTPATATTAVSAVAVDSLATVKIQQAKDLYAANEADRTATIVVKNGTSERTYTVVFQRIVLGSETTAKIKVLVYPNPCTEVLYFQAAPNATIHFVDRLGRKLNVAYTQENDQLKADVKHLPQGVYLLSIGTKKGATTQRFVKE